MRQWLGEQTILRQAQISLAGLLLAALLPASAAAQAQTTAADTPAERPAYQVDTSWPQQPLPNRWLIGDVGNVSVDRHNHIWVVHRPSTLESWDIGASQDPPIKCCIAAPPVLEFDTDGNLLRAWGGPKEIENWFDSEHGIFVDDEDHVWILGAGATDGQLLKFTMDGELLLRIGKKGEFGAADDPGMLGMPTDIYVDTVLREVYVADGYRNHRVIVFDADSGAFKRQWTVYGKEVDPRYFSGAEEVGSRGPRDQADLFTTVHCITKIGQELFVCDRTNSRIQVFDPDGTYIREIFYNRGEAGAGGSTWDAAPLPGHPDRIVVLDGVNSEFAVLDSSNGDVISSYLAKGRYAGQMHWPHQLAVDQQGRLYIAEVGGAARIQRFVPVSAAGD